MPPSPKTRIINDHDVDLDRHPALLCSVSDGPQRVLRHFQRLVGARQRMNATVGSDRHEIRMRMI
jgi:hypothetical protein